MTGFYRTGCCETGPEDVGAHVVCAEMTEEFLEFSKARGNDLSTPAPTFGFPGLEAGRSLVPVRGALAGGAGGGRGTACRSHGDPPRPYWTTSPSTTSRSTRWIWHEYNVDQIGTGWDPRDQR
jgi:hypothetical protein